MRELEAQAKALAPVLKGYVASAIEILRGSLEKSLTDQTDAMRGEIKKAIDSIAVPSAEEVAALIPAPKDGEKGDAGESGKDADPELVKNLIAEAIKELPAPKDGAPGRDGEKGADGASLPIEEVQRMVAEEVAKAMQGIQPAKDGEPGRDALAIEIMPAIDEAKSYVRGTFAQHSNGLWRAYERTHGMKGWECIVAGVASLEIEQDGERQFSIKSFLSDGREVVKSVHVPAMVYRGVFKDGMHHPGDTVTWGGSLWHCDEPTADKPGEVGSKGWTLAAKRGRDGKDGRNGKDMTKGVAMQ